MNPDTPIFVAGHRGMVGSALLRALRNRDHRATLTASREEADLTDFAATDAWFAAHRPEVAVIAAARVGGIHANNTYPADFIRDNLAIALNCIEAAHRHDVRRLLFLGSSCIYPKHAPQPMPEDCLMTAPLEPTNESYAIAKIAGLKLCQSYRRQFGRLYHSAMPTNLYGPGDNYHPENGHAMAMLIRRFHEAARDGRDSVAIWGTGTPRREYLYADDLAEALLFLLEAPDPPDWVNVGTGIDHSMMEVSQTIADVVGFTGRIETDPSKPDGTPRKLMEVSRLNALGWKARTGLREGIAAAYEDFKAGEAAGTLRAV